jgi:hypothetical protein
MVFFIGIADRGRTLHQYMLGCFRRQRMSMEREQCRKDILPDRVHLGHGVNNDMTVILRWSAIKYIQDI